MSNIEIYTKSINSGLEINFNSLPAVREFLKTFYWHRDAILEIHARNTKTDNQKSWYATNGDDALETYKQIKLLAQEVA